ncbi:hypothetical protein PanWU01x14_241700 [Parasponia andersonii]|uniref:Uncharacterized protein n=1 Tax=Parasponia andersonii TaxID=3476 RepID=A0A2P5BG79_PARAD|nr:hypothetical protein PanWU01x14_241700 [Parasponia andersonii]
MENKGIDVVNVLIKNEGIDLIDVPVKNKDIDVVDVSVKNNESINVVSNDGLVIGDLDEIGNGHLVAEISFKNIFLNDNIGNESVDNSGGGSKGGVTTNGLSTPNLFDEDIPLNPWINTKDPINPFFHEAKQHSLRAIQAVLIHKPEQHSLGAIQVDLVHDPQQQQPLEAGVTS